MRRRIRQTADFCRWSLYLTVVLAAVFLVLCRLLITHLYFYQAQIETYLSESLSTYVTAQEARGVWDTLYPVIELEYVRVGQDQVDPGLEATFIRAVPNYLQSLRLQTAIWEELFIEDLTIDLNQRSDGSWAIAGIDANGSNGNGVSDAAAKLTDMLFRSRSIEIENLRLDYFFEDGRNFNLNLSEMRAENERDFHRISLIGQVDGDENGIEAVLELTGQDYRFRSMQGQGFLALSGADMSNLFSALLEGYFDDSADIPVVTEGELWFDIEPNAQVQMLGNVRVSDLTIQGFDGSVAISSQLWGERTVEGDWRLDLVEMQSNLANQQMDTLGLSIQTAGDGFGILTERIALDDLVQRVLDLDFAPQRLRDALTSISPRGDLTSASLQLVDDNQGYRWHIEGRLENAYTESYGGVPRFENLNAHFMLDDQGGTVLIDSVDTSVHFDRLFDQKIFNRQLQGQVGWRFDRGSGELHVYSGAISSTNEYGAKGSSQFYLLTPISSGDFASSFTLISGLKEGTADLWPQYLPVRGNESLIQWFEGSGIEGAVPEVGFIYRGYIRSGSEYAKTVQLMGETANNVLKFAPEWPLLTEVDSRFVLSDRKFYLNSPHSKLNEVALIDSNVEIEISEQSHLVSSALLIGDLNDIFDLARETPARSGIGDSLDDLRFSGHAEVSFSLEQPIALDVSKDDIYVSADTTLSNIDINIASLDLSVESIVGRLVYDDEGLRSSDISANFWGNELAASISTEPESGILVSLNSEIEMERLKSWIDDPLIANLDGSFQFESELSIPLTQKPKVFQLRSNSQGISTNLPAPLGKAADAIRPFELSLVSNQSGGSTIDIAWGESLDSSIDLDERGALEAAAFGISVESPAKENGKIFGSLVLDKFDYLEWSPLFESESEDDYSLFPQIDISSEETWFSGLDIGPSRSRLALYQGDMEVGFATAFGEGRFVLEQASDDVPHRLTFNWLDLAQFPGVSDYFAAENQMIAYEDIALEGTENAAVDYDPRKFPHLLLDLVELRYGESDLGQWFFEMKPHALGLSISNIQSVIADAQIDADSMSRIEWGYNGSEHLTEIDMQLDLGDVGEIFQQVRGETAVSSESGTLDARLGWLGVPWQPSIEQLSGTVDLELNDGKFDAEADGNDLLTLVALFSIDNWGRRLKFDFSDLTEEGTGYRVFRGNFGVENGLVTTLSPVQINLTTGSLRFSGDMDLIENQVNAELVATLPVRNNLAWVTAAFMGIPAAAGVWLFGELFKDELDSMASITYLVTGDLDAPDIDAKSAVDAQAASETQTGPNQARN